MRGTNCPAIPAENCNIRNMKAGLYLGGKVKVPTWPLCKDLVMKKVLSTLLLFINRSDEDYG
jgi:hypothetical protein